MSNELTTLLWVGGVLCAAVLVVLAWQLARVRRQLAAHQETVVAQQAAEELRVQELQSEHDSVAAERHDQWSRWAEGVQQMLQYLVDVQLPAVLRGQPLPAWEAEPADAETAEWVASVLGAVVEFVTDSAERQESVRLAVVALARRVQTAAHRIQEQATVVARQSNGNASAAEACMQVDHMAAQAARHAQSMAVLCGEYPGQQWREPLALVDVVLAASGRIAAYRRVETSGDQVVAASPALVEPVVHAVAELLANATQSSPPASRVSVVVRSVARGAVIEIDDPGAGVDDHRLSQMQEVVSGRAPRGLADLGEVPQTGLAVVGEYVRRHQLNADVQPTPYGGLRALLFIPDEQLAALPSASAVRPQATPSAGGPAASPRAAGPALHPSGLPQRPSPRRAPAPAAQQPAASPSASPVSARQETPQETGDWVRRFTGGGADQPAAGEPSAEHPDSREDR